MSRRHAGLGTLLVIAVFVGSIAPRATLAAPICDGPDPPPACEGEPRETDMAPIGFVDEIARQVDQVRIRGWAIDRDTSLPIAIHIYADGKFVTAVIADQARADVAAVYPNFGARHGYDVVIPSPGRRICVYAINQNSAFENRRLGCGDVAVEPFGFLDEVARQGDLIRIRGWVIDPDTVAPIDIHVYAGPTFIASAKADQLRPDVAAVFGGYGPAHGFELSIPNSLAGELFCVFAINHGAGSANPTIGCKGLVRGFAEIHNHQFSYFAFGGSFVVGAAYGPPEIALSSLSDQGAHGPYHVLLKGRLSEAIAERGIAGLANLPSGNDGHDSYENWPRFNEIAHQKMYQDWLERAVKGGLRLTVVFAVESPILCTLLTKQYALCNDEMRSIDYQISAAYAMQDAIDEQAGGAGKGWYRIVTTPDEAMRVIQEGKLAVVLGIETAHLFNCSEREPFCDWRPALDYFWSRGVRHFYPIHQDDNAFGGASYFSPGVQIALPSWAKDLNVLDIRHPHYFLYTNSCPFASGRCNILGLTNEGRELVDALMRRGAIIDVDHMSQRSFDDTLGLAEAFGYPVVASHAGFNAINNDAQDHEGQLSDEDLARIRHVGGMIGLITGQGTRAEVHTYYRRPGQHYVEQICGGTTETFAQAYYYMYDHAPGTAVGIGTDFNAPLVQPGPRFGDNKCSGNEDRNPAGQWQQRLEYPFLARGSLTQMDKYQFGSRTFDYNEDGLIHAGLLPDFFADLEALGMPSRELEPLFYSAEGYIHMWQRAEARKPSPNTVAPSAPEGPDEIVCNSKPWLCK